MNSHNINSASVQLMHSQGSLLYLHETTLIKPIPVGHLATVLF